MLPLVDVRLSVQQTYMIINELNMIDTGNQSFIQKNILKSEEGKLQKRT